MEDSKYIVGRLLKLRMAPNVVNEFQLSVDESVTFSLWSVCEIGRIQKWDNIINDSLQNGACGC